MVGRSFSVRRGLPALGICILSILVGLRLARWLTEVEVGLPLALAKALGLLAFAALRPGVPGGALPAWRLWMVGGTLNLAAISLSGWRMPISHQAIEMAGLGAPPPDYVLASSAPQLLLGDSIPMLWPVPTAVSVGDLLLAAGIFMLGWYLFGRTSHPAAPPTASRAGTHTPGLVGRDH